MNVRNQSPEMGDLPEAVRKPGSGHRLVLFPLPFQGHMSAMLQLANILYSQGFSITVIHTELNSPSPSSFPHFTFCSISDGLSALGWDSASDVNLVTLLTVLNANCVKPFRTCLTDILQSASDSSEDQISCLITDSVWHFSQSVADELCIRRMELRTTSVSSFSAFSALLTLRRKGYLPLQGASIPYMPSHLRAVLLLHPWFPDSYLHFFRDFNETLYAAYRIYRYVSEW